MVLLLFETMWKIPIFFLKNTMADMHEVTHLWLGDLVSVKWLDSWWLKEGFAQYFQFLILKDCLSDYSETAMDQFTEKESIKTFELFQNDTVVHNLSEIDFNQRVLKSIMYHKGAFIVKMLNDLIEEDNSFKICNS